ncbi:MAG: hypothetical protein COT14_03710 [Candidatus Diapherotrites archaeon CG08_land_8_20_14_0_20_30_16]|nr:MAG: hypothetical protein COT14_03710 [Candidatus Diapherotrites archaeon CG08_land_8_20_14_0_20_30_16]
MPEKPPSKRPGRKPKPFDQLKPGGIANRFMKTHSAKMSELKSSIIDDIGNGKIKSYTQATGVLIARIKNDPQIKADLNNLKTNNPDAYNYVMKLISMWLGRNFQKPQNRS